MLFYVIPYYNPTRRGDERLFPARAALKRDCMTASTIYLLRHAETAPQPKAPNRDWPLSARGRDQAIRLSPILAQFAFAHVYCSPARRCLDTIRAFVALTGVPLTLHPGLRERDFGSDWLVNYREVRQRCRQDRHYVPEGGESATTCCDRMGHALVEIGQQHARQSVLVVSHGTAMELFLASVDRAFRPADAVDLRTPELFKLTCDGNVVRWHRDFDPGPEFDNIARADESIAGSGPALNAGTLR